ncbi:MAG: hypothetical protein RL531_501, partial [Actinomycetota bacterium]
MEKLIYLVWGAPGSEPRDHHRILIDEVAPRLLALDPLQLWMQVDDADADVPVPLPAPAGEHLPMGLVSIWLP